MYKDLIMQGLMVLIQLFVLFVMGVIINYLQKKISNEKLKAYYDLVKKGIQAAEQVYGAGQGEEKKAWVLEYLTKVLGKKLSADDINLLIESAVHEMNLVLKNIGLEATANQDVAAPVQTVQQ